MPALKGKDVQLSEVFTFELLFTPGDCTADDIAEFWSAVRNFLLVQPNVTAVHFTTKEKSQCHSSAAVVEVSLAGSGAIQASVTLAKMVSPKP